MGMKRSQIDYEAYSIVNYKILIFDQNTQYLSHL